MVTKGVAMQLFAILVEAEEDPNVSGLLIVVAKDRTSAEDVATKHKGSRYTVAVRTDTTNSVRQIGSALPNASSEVITEHWAKMSNM